MATKTRKKRRATVVTVASLRQRALRLALKEKLNITKLRKKIKKNKGEYPSGGCDCNLCQAARYLRRSDRLKKAA